MNSKWLIITVIVVPFLLICGCRTGKDDSKKGASQISGEAGNNKPDPGISIHEASLNGQLSQVMDLLAAGQDVNSADEDGRTALMYAAYNGHAELLKRLLEKGALVNLCDTNGRTALMLAASGPFPEAVKLLLSHNADPNLADKEEHFTALMYASAEGQLDVVKILLFYRADPTLKDVDGDDAITFATNNGHKNVADLLQSLKK